jgi:glycyl-tRNA synthetase
VDYDTLKDDTVTVRDRDSWKQIRCHVSQLRELLHNYFQGKIDFDDLGKAI